MGRLVMNKIFSLGSMIEQGRIIREKEEAQREERKRIAIYKTEALNDRFVETKDKEYTVRIERDGMWVHAHAKVDDEIIFNSFCPRILERIFSYERLKKHMLLYISLVKKKKYKRVTFYYDAEQYGGNVYFKIGTKKFDFEWLAYDCFGHGYRFMVELLKLKHDKKKVVWMNLSENLKIINYL